MSSTSTRPRPGLYLAGYFTSYNGTPAEKIAIVDLATKQLVPNLPPWTPTTFNGRDYQQVIQEHGQNIFQGGSEHDFQVHDRDTYNLVQRYVPNPGRRLPGRGRGQRRRVRVVPLQQLRLHGRHRVARTRQLPACRSHHVHPRGRRRTGQLLNQFQPQVHSANTEGVWELFADSQGCMWFGGDENQGALVGGVRQWLGGYGRFCPPDRQPPDLADAASPSAPRSGGGNQIKWSGGTDNVAGNLSYEVLRNDRVISPVLLNTFVYNDTAGQLGDRYFVRTVDAAGNRSATTPVALVADTVKPSVPTNLGVGRDREPGRGDRVVDCVDRQLRRRGLPHLPQRRALRDGRAARHEPHDPRRCPPAAARSRSPRSTRPATSRPRPPASRRRRSRPTRRSRASPPGSRRRRPRNTGEALVSWNASTDNVGVTGLPRVPQQCRCGRR